VIAMRALWFGLLFGLGCFAHSSKGVDEIPAGMRIVNLSTAGDDTSCFRGRRGTLIADDLSNTDVQQIEALIRKADTWPIIRISRLSPERCRVAVCGEVEATTGVECGGALSGRGKDFHFRRADGVWLVLGVDDWEG